MILDYLRWFWLAPRRHRIRRNYRRYQRLTFITIGVLVPTSALAGQPGPGPGGSPSNPIYTAPATPQPGSSATDPVYAEPVPSAGVDGSILTLTPENPVVLFGGAVPANGFQIQATGANGLLACNVNDNGPAQVPSGYTGPALGQGYMIYAVCASPNFTCDLDGVNATYTTPQGYKPMGAVNLVCHYWNTAVYARAW